MLGSDFSEYSDCDLIIIGLHAGFLICALRVQTEYERYLSYLLDAHVDRYEILSHQIDQLSARHSIEGPLIREEEIWIGDLEDRVREQLEVNER